jgi:hypothetical protein
MDFAHTYSQDAAIDLEEHNRRRKASWHLSSYCSRSITNSNHHARLITTGRTRRIQAESKGLLPRRRRLPRYLRFRIRHWFGRRNHLSAFLCQGLQLPRRCDQLEGKHRFHSSRRIILWCSRCRPRQQRFGAKEDSYHQLYHCKPHVHYTFNHVF